MWKNISLGREKERGVISMPLEWHENNNKEIMQFLSFFHNFYF